MMTVENLVKTGVYLKFYWRIGE